ncbi:jouberin-like isoform X1 [Nasonia vitripennis]|uniref:Jouberin n=1 Tax=Nasonia vitripennis TaxID=7425 RepID=A0A7M7PW30_NASVI|nr:jouberin-like isoform X1 [Nasonia vitripennis]
MDPQKSSKQKSQRRGRLTKSRAVESSNESSSDEKSEDESRNLGSRLKLLRDKRRSAKSRKSRSERHSVTSDVEDTIVQIESSTEPAKPVPKESGIAQSIKRKFGFFRRSENVKSTEDIEAAVLESVDTPEADNRQTLDVVVDVHCENEIQKSKVIKKSVSSKEESSPEEKSLDLIEEFHEENDRNKTSRTSGFFEGDSEVESEIEVYSPIDRENDELTSEILPTSGGESSRRRKRWEKDAISADDLVEDLKKPKRKQWAKGTTSAKIREASGKRIVVPRRLATAEPGKSTRPKSSKPTKPVAASRSKSIQKEEIIRGFDNDGFSSDHDEVLRIETVNDQSPKIKIGSASTELIEDGASTLSEEEERRIDERKASIESVKDYMLKSLETTENSDSRDLSPSETFESPDFEKRKPVTRRRSSTKRKGSVDRRSLDDEDDEEEDEEEQETVLNVMDKRSRRSSGSSRIEIIPLNIFEKESSDETTISTNEEMHTSRKDSHRSRSKSKSTRREKSDDASERSSRTKRKTTSSSTRNSAEEYSSSRKRTKSKTKKRHKKREKKQQLDDVEEETKYISVKIHRSDMLEADYITRHPMVKVHIVNAITGEYLKTSDKDGESNVLSPVVTGKFDFKEKKSMVPVWEEELIFEHDFKNLLAEGKGAVVVLFEIVDLLTFTEASVCYDQFGKDACWYKIAWAFLRPVGLSGVQHTDKRVRLQLYRPKRSFRRAKKSKCEVYKWWKSNSRDKYPSSLYVSISAVEPPKVEPVFYDQLLQLNDPSEVRSDSQNVLSSKVEEEKTDRPKWTRLAAQSCQIPNESYLEAEASENGCFYVTFSHDGKYLACALSEEYDYPILVYKIDEGKIHVRFSGHKNFVYHLSWSQDDRYLLSVSSDQTARFWDVGEKIIEPVQSLPHPSYVYCGRFSHDTSNHVITGCYDHVARVWARLRSNHKYELVQELEAHESFITTVCFQPKDDTCLTGDGLGVIVVWTTKKSRKSPIRREWQIARKIKIRDIEGVPINTIVMHPLGSRLLVHSRNDGLRLIDMISGVVVRKFEGLKNQRIQITACISPCGSLLFCGGEDSTLNVWSVENGKLLATYEVESHEKAVTCVDYHPYDHVFAFSTYGAPVPVKILKYDREADGSRVGLKLLAMTTSMMSVSSSIRLKDQQPPIARNGGRNPEKLSARSLNSSANVSQIGSVAHLLTEYKDNDDVRGQLRGKLQKFMESGPNLKAKSMNRLNGIIEKIDKILMYATNQKSPAMDLESARNSSVFMVEERHSREVFELQELPVVEHDSKRDKKSRKHRPRSKSARNACSPTPKEIEASKALSDSAAFNRKVSRFSDDSSNSNRSVVYGKFMVERLELEKIEYVDTESGFKDSLDTIIDGKEDFPSEEVLDVQSLKSDDTYVVDKEKSADNSEGNDSSERSNATFIIESEVPIPKPRKRIGRIEVM